MQENLYFLDLEKQERKTKCKKLRRRLIKVNENAPPIYMSIWIYYDDIHNVI